MRAAPADDDDDGNGQRLLLPNCTAFVRRHASSTRIGCKRVDTRGRMRAWPEELGPELMRSFWAGPAERCRLSGAAAEGPGRRQPTCATARRLPAARGPRGPELASGGRLVISERARPAMMIFAAIIVIVLVGAYSGCAPASNLAVAATNLTARPTGWPTTWRIPPAVAGAAVAEAAAAAAAAKGPPPTRRDP
jgi:hypothetical protein